MRTIPEPNLLLREPVEMPAGLKLMAEEFQEGWSLARSLDAGRLEKRIHTHGWNFIKIADGSPSSGVGETLQEAIARALRLALRRVSQHSNAVTFENIALTQYPWFFLAGVKVSSYRIQQSAALPAPDDADAPPTGFPRKRLPRQSAVLYPHSGSAMPMLKEMLNLSRSTYERAQ